MFNILNYNKRQKISSIEELKSVLTSDYQNSHVGIVFTLPSGVKQIKYVSVSKKGFISQTYNEIEPFDFSVLEKAVNQEKECLPGLVN
ncbi:hypothetical protein [Thiomicrorhabdus hydrogeniphila]